MTKNLIVLKGAQKQGKSSTLLSLIENLLNKYVINRQVFKLVEFKYVDFNRRDVCVLFEVDGLFIGVVTQGDYIRTPDPKNGKTVFEHLAYLQGKNASLIVCACRDTRIKGVNEFISFSGYYLAPNDDVLIKNSSFIVNNQPNTYNNKETCIDKCIIYIEDRIKNYVNNNTNIKL